VGINPTGLWGGGNSAPYFNKGDKMKEDITIEIRAAEGGMDAKLLVNDQYDIYRNYCRRECL